MKCKINKQDEYIEIEDNFKGYRRITFTILLLIIISIGYTYYSKFNIEKEAFSINDKYIKEGVEVLDDLSLIINFDEKEINYYLRNYIDETNFWLDVDKKQMKFNLEFNKVPIPIIANIDTKVVNDDVLLNFDNLKWGRLGIPINIFDNKFNTYINNKKINIIDTRDLNLPYFIHIKNIKFSNNLQMVFEINDKEMNNVFKLYLNDIDNQIVEYYSNSNDNTHKFVYKVIKQKELLPEDIKILVEDFLNDKKIVKAFLTALSDKSLSVIVEKYNNGLLEIKKDEIYKEKDNCKAKNYEKNCINLLLALNKYKEENNLELYHIGLNNPYDIVTNKIITPAYLNKLYKLLLSDVFIKEAKFIYEIESKEYRVAINLSKNSILLCSNNEYTIIEKVKFDKLYPIYKYEKVRLLSKENNDRKSIESVIESFIKSDELFCRYITSDGNNAYVIASSSNSDQEINSYYLYKNDNTWEIIGIDVEDLKKFNDDFPQYNITLVPSKIVSPEKFTLISDNDKHIIINDLYEKNIIKNKDKKQLIYCSYYKPYISIMLNDGREFVYVISYGVLNEIYSKETAKSKFSDIPNILFVQD